MLPKFKSQLLDTAEICCIVSFPEATANSEVLPPTLVLIDSKLSNPQKDQIFCVDAHSYVMKNTSSGEWQTQTVRKIAALIRKYAQGEIACHDHLEKLLEQADKISSWRYERRCKFEHELDTFITSLKSYIKATKGSARDAHQVGRIEEFELFNKIAKFKRIRPKQHELMIEVRYLRHGGKHRWEFHESAISHLVWSRIQTSYDYKAFSNDMQRIRQLWELTHQHVRLPDDELWEAYNLTHSMEKLEKCFKQYTIARDEADNSLELGEELLDFYRKPSSFNIEKRCQVAPNAEIAHKHNYWLHTNQFQRTYLAQEELEEHLTSSKCKLASMPEKSLALEKQLMAVLQRFSK